MTMHENDRLAALNWAVRVAEEAAAVGFDPLAPMNLAALREIRDEAKKEAGQ